jgi:polysaccharide export outer membrane protein
MHLNKPIVLGRNIVCSLLLSFFMMSLPAHAFTQSLSSGNNEFGFGDELSTGLGNDPCANSLDKPGCYKNLTGAKGQNIVQPTPDTEIPASKQYRSPKVTAMPEHSEFQDFISNSLGKTLPMYGYNLFNDVPDTFAPVENIPVTPNYLIGPGDEIVIRGWGKVDINIHAVVDRDGEINLPKVGAISVTGIRYQELQGYLKKAIGHVFRNFKLDVTLGKLRSVQVFVVGQARQPGVYTVSSLSTLVDTLFASGGPSTKGSLRHIQVKRNGRIVTELDMYDLLLKGDKSKDIPLLPGDVIYIPPVGHLVAISGSVNNPAIYELKDDNTTLADMLSLAGGLTSVAAGDKVRVERITDHDMRQVDEFPLDKAGLARTLKDGDLVQVDSILGRFDNAVTLSGNVASPGRYPWTDGMRISDLIPGKDFLITRAYWAGQNQDGHQGKNDAGLRSELLGRARAEVNWDYAVIERLNKTDLTTNLIPFNLGHALENKDSPDNQKLEEGDIITIFSKNDIKVPVAERSVFVRLEGEVKYAGVYKALPGETLRQLVVRVGGLTPQAFLFGAELDRESVRAMQQKHLQKMADRMQADIQRNLADKQQSATTADEINSAKLQAQAQAQLVNHLKQVQASGRIVLGIPPQDSNVTDLPDLVLEDGDRFFVPGKPSTASVMGMVYNENTFIFKSGARVSDYLAKAGGPTRDADASRIYLLRADGSVLSGQSSSSMFNSFYNQKLIPGDTVVVPEMLDKFYFTKSLKDTSQIFYQFALGVAGLKILGMF